MGVVPALLVKTGHYGVCGKVGELRMAVAHMGEIPSGFEFRHNTLEDYMNRRNFFTTLIATLVLPFITIPKWNKLPIDVMFFDGRWISCDEFFKILGNENHPQHKKAQQLFIKALSTPFIKENWRSHES